MRHFNIRTFLYLVLMNPCKSAKSVDKKKPNEPNFRRVCVVSLSLHCIYHYSFDLVHLQNEPNQSHFLYPDLWKSVKSVVPISSSVAMRRLLVVVGARSVVFGRLFRPFRRPFGALCLPENPLFGLMKRDLSLFFSLSSPFTDHCSLVTDNGVDRPGLRAYYKARQKLTGSTEIFN
jgi:hypothetical protein